MTEAEFRDCRDPNAMLDYLLSRPDVSMRKVRLWACACVRRVWHSLVDERSRLAVKVAEDYADGVTGADELKTARQAAWASRSITWESRAAGAISAWVANENIDADTLRWVGKGAGLFLEKATTNDGCSLLNDIFAPMLFRPVQINPEWLAWNNGAVPELARAIYRERQLPSGHFDGARLGILADLFMEASCHDEEILGHLRGSEPHVRGCWVIDLLLKKE